MPFPRQHSPLCIFPTSPPFSSFSIPLHQATPPSPSTHHPLPITLSPRWLWGRPVWNVIGIIPFSLIASAGEQPYVSHRVPTEPLRTHYAHISHRNLLKAESNVHARMHMLSWCITHVLHCTFLCLSLSINSQKVRHWCWWGSVPSLP